MGDTHMEADKTRTTGWIFSVVGITGLGIVLALNLVGISLLNQPAANFFSERWWSDWFPAYTAWPVMLTIGVYFWLASGQKAPTDNA